MSIDVDKLNSIVSDNELWEQIRSNITDLMSEEMIRFVQSMVLDTFDVPPGAHPNFDKETLRVALADSSMNWTFGCIVGMVYTHRHGIPGDLLNILSEGENDGDTEPQGE